MIKGGTLDGSELDNAASEATLRLLLEEMKRLSKQDGVKAKKTTKEISDLGKSAKSTADAADDLSEEFRTLGGDLRSLARGSIRILGDSIVGLAGSVNSTAKFLVDFGADLINTQPEITDFTSVLANSRLNILGLGTAVHRLTELMMGNYRSFQTLSQSGLFLGDRIEKLQSDFTALGVDAGTLTSALANNAELFALNGSASFAAAKALDGMRKGIGDTRQELLTYGITLEEQTEIFTAMYARNTRALRTGLVTNEEINDQSARYAKSLRLISELTGVSARELEDQQRRLDQEQAFQLKLRQLEKADKVDEANRLREYVSYMESAFDEGGRDLAIAQTIGTTATTEAAIALQGYGIGINEFAAEMRRVTADSNLTAEEFRNYFAERGQELASMQVLSKDLSTAQQLINLGQGQVVNSILKFVRIFDDEIEKINSNLGNIDESGKVIGSFTDLMAAFRSGVAAVSKSFFANKTVQKGLVSFRSWLDSFTTQANEFDINEFWETYNPFDETGRAQILDGLTTTFKSFWEGPNAVVLRDTISGFFEYMVDELILGINKTTGGMFYGSASDDIRIKRIEEAANLDTPLTPEQQALLDEKNRKAIYKDNTDAIGRINNSVMVKGLALVDLAANLLGDVIDWGTGRDDMGEMDLSGMYQDIINNNALLLQQAKEKVAAPAPAASPNNFLESFQEGWMISPKPDAERRIGTLRATGFKSEPKDTVAKIHQGERVLNPSETAAFNNQAQNQSDMIKKLDQLNNTMSTVASLMSQELSIQTRTMNSIGGLGTDLMKGIPR